MVWDVAIHSAVSRTFPIQHGYIHLDEKKKMTTAVTVIFLGQQKVLSNILIARAFNFRANSECNRTEFNQNYNLKRRKYFNCLAKVTELLGHLNSN